MSKISKLEELELPGQFIGVLTDFGKHRLNKPLSHADYFPVLARGMKILDNDNIFPGPYSDRIPAIFNNNSVPEVIVFSDGYVIRKKVDSNLVVVKKRLLSPDIVREDPIYEELLASFGDAVKHLGLMAINYDENWLNEPLCTISYGVATKDNKDLRNRYILDRNEREANRSGVYQRASVAMPKSLYEEYAKEIKADPRLGRYIMWYMLNSQSDNIKNHAILPNFRGIDKEIADGGIGNYVCGLVYCTGNDFKSAELLKYPKTTEVALSFDR